jgi:5-methyltetrahydropteroyltriglutamate--homocysteine methyltransferase
MRRSIRRSACRKTPDLPWSRTARCADWLAQRLFPRIGAQRLLLEYDDERSGGFEPLAMAPEDKTAVLGLVTTKTGRRETVDELETRIREAARYQPLEHLALSPQCGFATSILGNALSIADEEAKLRTIVTTAERVWG